MVPKAGLLSKTSLDAPIVGIVWLCFLAHQEQTKLEPSIYWLLFSSIWSIYALDRIFESDQRILHSRHLFHKRWAGLFVSTLLLASMFNLGLLFTYPPSYLSSLLRWSLIPVTGSLVYLCIPLLWKTTSPTKEWIKNTLSSTVFSFGCSLPLWAKAHTSSGNWTFIVEILVLAILMFINLRLLASTSSTNQRSIPTETLIALAPMLLLTVLQPTWVTITWLLSATLMICVYLTPWTRHRPPLYDLSLIIIPLFSILIDYSVSKS